MFVNYTCVFLLRILALPCSRGSAYSEVGLMETCLAYLTPLLDVSFHTLHNSLYLDLHHQSYANLDAYKLSVLFKLKLS